MVGGQVREVVELDYVATTEQGGNPLEGLEQGGVSSDLHLKRITLVVCRKTR